jgi:hypothetical protein
MGVRKTAAPSEQRKQLDALAAVWRKQIDALIGAPLFKDGVVDREAHDALRQHESEARQQLADFLDAVLKPRQ